MTQPSLNTLKFKKFKCKKLKKVSKYLLIHNNVISNESRGRFSETLMINLVFDLNNFFIIKIYYLKDY